MLILQCFLMQEYLGGLKQPRNKVHSTPWRLTSLKTTFTHHKGKSCSWESNHVKQAREENHANFGIHNIQRRLDLCVTWQEVRRRIWSCDRFGLQCWVLDHDTQATHFSAHCLRIAAKLSFV